MPSLLGALLFKGNAMGLGTATFERAKQAQYLASRLVEPLPETDQLSLKLLRTRIEDMLSDFYDEIARDKDKDLIDADTLANIIGRKLKQMADRTAWASHFEKTPIRLAMHSELVLAIKSILERI